MASPQRRRRPAALLLAMPLLLCFCGAVHAHAGGDLRRVVEVRGEPGSVVWAVQLSDLHISAFHPERAADFRRHVGDALALVNPSLVLITGDLTGRLPSYFLYPLHWNLVWVQIWFEFDVGGFAFRL
ncbi:unnamed protein product [Urochloa humidicola]